MCTISLLDRNKSISILYLVSNEEGANNSNNKNICKISFLLVVSDVMSSLRSAMLWRHSWSLIFHIDSIPSGFAFIMSVARTFLFMHPTHLVCLQVVGSVSVMLYNDRINYFVSLLKTIIGCSVHESLCSVDSQQQVLLNLIKIVTITTCATKHCMEWLCTGNYQTLFDFISGEQFFAFCSNRYSTISW